MPKSAYLYYMLHYKKIEEGKGRHFPRGLDDVKDAASASWQGMTKEERRKFEDKAKSGKSSVAGINSTVQSNHSNRSSSNNSRNERYTSQGVPLSQIESEVIRKQNEDKYIKRRIQNFVQSLPFPDGFANCPIYLAAGNYFYIHDGDYIPAEFAITKFNFEQGIIKTYHTFLNPSTVEMGYRNEAKMHSESTHRLPLPPNCDGVKKERFNDVVYADIKRMLNTEVGTFDGGKPFVFTSEGVNDENIVMLKSFMKQFSLKEESPIDVFPMHMLLFTMKDVWEKECNIPNDMPTAYVAKAILLRETLEHRPNLGCDFHDAADNGKYCALSMVKRWCFMLCDKLCPDIGITIEAGRHVPKDSDIRSISCSASQLSLHGMDFQRNPSSTSVLSGNSSRLFSRSHIFDAVPELAVIPQGRSMFSGSASNISFSNVNTNESASEMEAETSQFARRFWTPGRGNSAAMSVVSRSQDLHSEPKRQNIVKGRGRLFSSSNETLTNLTNTSDDMK